MSLICRRTISNFTDLQHLSKKESIEGCVKWLCQICAKFETWVFHSVNFIAPVHNLFDYPVYFYCLHTFSQRCDLFFLNISLGVIFSVRILEIYLLILIKIYNFIYKACVVSNTPCFTVYKYVFLFCVKSCIRYPINAFNCRGTPIIRLAHENAWPLLTMSVAWITLRCEIKYDHFFHLCVSVEGGLISRLYIEYFLLFINCNYVDCKNYWKILF